MTSLDKAIKHYRAIMKSGKPLQSHYATGALDVLLKVKEVRDSFAEDCKNYWKDRGSPFVGTTETFYHMSKHAKRMLDDLMDD